MLYVPRPRYQKPKPQPTDYGGKIGGTIGNIAGTVIGGIYGGPQGAAAGGKAGGAALGALGSGIQEGVNPGSSKFSTSDKPVWEQVLNENTEAVSNVMDMAGAADDKAKAQTQQQWKDVGQGTGMDETQWKNYLDYLGRNFMSGSSQNYR